MKAAIMAAFAALLVATLSGCAAPQGQAGEVPKDFDFLAHHVEATCPIEITGTGGIHAYAKECAMKVASGAQAATTYECTGQTGGSSAFRDEFESTWTFVYYTPGGIQAPRVYGYDVDSGTTRQANCTLKGPMDKAGTYELSFQATCLKDSKTWLPGLQAAPDGCTPTKDSLTIDQKGDWKFF
jgi:hypothetical protein